MNAKLVCCSDPRCDVGLKNNYFPNKRITPESFQIEQDYLVERRRLINRATLGWGVVYGLATEFKTPDEDWKDVLSNGLTIEQGLALDHCGRELFNVDDLLVDLDQVIPVETAEKPAGRIKIRKNDNGDRVDVMRVINEVASTLDEGESSCWLLRVHYAEQKMNRVLVDDSCQCERTKWDHTCETIRFSIEEIDCNKCCYHDECDWDCECRDEECCDPKKNLGRRGGCHCLCEQSKNADVLAHGACGEPCKLEEPCGVVGVDLQRGVSLACLKIYKDDNGGLNVEMDDCGPRRLVKRNDLLFDLIRGCDLTTIKEIGWAKHHRGEMTIEQLRDCFKDKNDKECISNTFWIEFSRAVRVESLKPDCFILTVYFQGPDTGWWEPYRVPIERIEATEYPNNPGLATRAAIVIPSAFVEEQSFGYRRFQSSKALVEIEVRGDYIIDCNGQAVDANAASLPNEDKTMPCEVRFGNGSPGGTFHSSFRVPPEPQQ